jgi:hypothetical protein
VSRQYYADPGTTPERVYGSSQQPQVRHTGGRRKGARLALFTAIAAVLVLGAGIGDVVEQPSNAATSNGFVPTAGSTSGDAEQLANAFLAAWGKDDLAQAAAYTSDPSAALPALQRYWKYLNLRSLSGSSQTAVATTSKAAGVPTAAALAAGASPASAAESGTLEQVTLGLKAKVASSSAATALSGDWSYTTTLNAYQSAGSSAWYIKWAPGVVAPNLGATQHLAAIVAPPQVIQVTDSNGNPLSGYNDPGLTTIAGLLQQDGDEGQGKDGLYVQIDTASGKAVPNSQAVVVAPQNIGQLKTTISSKAENLARTAVQQHSGSSAVVIQPSTGHILAIANNAQDNDFALTAQVAPGSTMKIITSTALFNGGYTTANSPVACPSVVTVTGVSIHNDDNESEPASTPFAYDFAQSCNDAFTQWYPDLYGKLASTAKDYYGLDQPWNIGIGKLYAQYFEAPASAQGSELAEEAFGQGKLIAAPIAMASVVATVDTGSFKQPILVAGAKQLTAKPLPSSTDSQLKEMMRDVVTEGTAEGLGFGPDVYAKTGTADVSGQDQPNSWFVAFDPQEDVAIAILDVNAGYGAQFAAPETQYFLSHY